MKKYKLIPLILTIMLLLTACDKYSYFYAAPADGQPALLTVYDVRMNWAETAIYPDKLTFEFWETPVKREY